MILAYALALHTVIGARIDIKEIPLQWVRPSKVLAQLKIGGLSQADITADDVKGVLIVKGSDEEIRGVQSIANLFDVHRRSISLKVSVDSKIDKLGYDCKTTIANNQTWRTSDDEIGVAISITPRINDDNTITYLVELGQQGKRLTRIVVRGKMNESLTFSMGKDGPKYIDGPNSHVTPKLSAAEAVDPQVKITATAW